MDGKNNRHKVILISATVVIVAAVGWLMYPRDPEPVKVEVIQQEAYIPPAARERAKSPVQFTDVTQHSGVAFSHFTGATVDAEGKPSRFMPETMGPGVAMIDYDLDNDLDIFVVNSASFDGEGDHAAMSPKLYRNDGDFTFTDVTETLGLGFMGYGMGVAVADYNGDRYPDILITGWNMLKLYENKAGKSFADVSAGIFSTRPSELPLWSTGAVFFDADGDSDLDLYVAHYVLWTPDSDVFATLNGRNKSYATPDLYAGSSSRLFIQEKGMFTDATEGSGMNNDQGKSLGTSLWDFNDDGLLDIVVANDTQPNFMYYNLGGGKFENRALEAGIAYDANGKTRAGMGIDVADVANDGHTCIAIGNFSREPVSIFRDEGGGFFRESSQQSGVAEATYMVLTFGLNFADFDLDGWQDIILANGHIEPEIEQVEAEIKYRQPLTLLGNKAGKGFENWSQSAGAVFNKPMVGRGLAVGDLDADGDIDIIASENGGGVHLLRNDSATDNQFLRVNLHGRAPNTNAIGAKLTLISPDGMRQTRIVRGGASYLSQSEFTQTFGLGDSREGAVLELRWPSGRKQTVAIKKFNTTLVIAEDSDPAPVLSER